MVARAENELSTVSPGVRQQFDQFGARRKP
jgi:hypothetical protein